MKIFFTLRLVSKDQSKVQVSCDRKILIFSEGVSAVEKEIDIWPDRGLAEQYPILEVKNLEEGRNTALKIENFSINSVDVGKEELQDYFSLSLIGNRYAKDSVLEKVSEICFNGQLNLLVGKDIRKFFWSPYYASRKRNDFVYDNRLASVDNATPHYWSVNERLGEKVYTNIPHKPIDQNKNYELGCFGCSLTFGTGLKHEEVWPSLLTENHLNFSVQGLGIDGIYLNLANSIKKFKWKSTVIVLPHWERKILRFHLPSGEITRVPVTLTGEWAHSQFKHWAWKTFNRQLSKNDLQRWKKIYQKNIQSLVNGKVEEYSKKVLTKIVSICEKYDRTLYLTSWDEDTHDNLKSFVTSDRILPFFEKIDLARDEAHHGPESHKKWTDLARTIIKK